MKEANPRVHLNRLITDRNYLGAQLFLRESELETDERNELLGALATAVVDELSRTTRDDRERLAYLRSVLAWILREVPGLGSLYREQLRAVQGRSDVLTEFTRGFRNLGDVATGRKSVGEGLEEAAEDARRNFEDATERMRSGESGERVNEFLNVAERGLRQGLDQLGSFFRGLNEERDGDPPESHEEPPRPGDVEDAEVVDDDSDTIHVERE